MIGAKVVEPGLGKPSASPPPKPLRASSRHPNSCCGVIPCCRATSETTAPGCWLSSTMRALTSGDQRRRRPTPVITSMRCKPSGARSPRSAVGLSVLPSRCLLMGSHYEHAELILEGGKESPLTIQQQRRRARRGHRYRQDDPPQRLCDIRPRQAHMRLGLRYSMARRCEEACRAPRVNRVPRGIARPRRSGNRLGQRAAGRLPQPYWAA